MKIGKNKKIIAAITAMILATGTAGCGNGQSEDKQGQAAGQESGSQTSTDAQEKDAGSAKDSGEGEKTEVRREDYPDCDGSGHGYREIYYSDGTMETEEY